MTDCILITLALYLISLIAMNVTLVELENKIETLAEEHADLQERIKACSKDLGLLEVKVDGLDMNSQGDDKLISLLMQRVGALEDARTTNEDTSE